MTDTYQLEKDYGNKVLWTGKKCIFGKEISFTRYILTATKLITRSGLLNIKEDEIELYRVYDKSLSLSITDRIFNCGTIKLMSKDADSPAKYIESVKNPREVKRIIDEAVQAQRDKYMVRGRDMIGGLDAFHEMGSDND